jgi:hypothetical protein
MTEKHYPEGFTDFLEFLCGKYGVDRSRVFIEYNSKPPPPIKGGRSGYYDGLLSYRKKDGHVEFLITVFEAARDPLLTLGHEFAHLVDDLKSEKIGKPLGPPDDARERKFDNLAMRDLNQFWMQRKIDDSKRDQHPVGIQDAIPEG